MSTKWKAALAKGWVRFHIEKNVGWDVPVEFRSLC